MFIVIPHVTKEVSTWSWRFYYFYYERNTSILAKHKALKCFLCMYLFSKWNGYKMAKIVHYSVFNLFYVNVVSMMIVKIQMAFKHWEYYSIICCIFIFLQAHKIYTYKKKLSVHKLNKVMVMQSLLHWIEHNLTNLQLLTFISYYI